MQMYLLLMDLAEDRHYQGMVRCCYSCMQLRLNRSFSGAVRRVFVQNKSA